MTDEKVLNMEKVGHESLFSYDPNSNSQSTDVEFEDYLYFAAVQRRAEDLATMPASEIEKVEKRNWFNRLSEHKGQNVNIDVKGIVNPIPATQDELERENASRALRLASWASVFYLITTDILGPFNAPFAISQTGWVPGTMSRLFLICWFISSLFLQASSSTSSVRDFTVLHWTWYNYYFSGIFGGLYWAYLVETFRSARLRPSSIVHIRRYGWAYLWESRPPYLYSVAESPASGQCTSFQL